ncbi:MAG: CAP domain-containing protein [Phycisphaerales bacterium]|nr:CAP domain-containing protein [Phycisphaerales bacterium]
MQTRIMLLLLAVPALMGQTCAPPSNGWNPNGSGGNTCTAPTNLDSLRADVMVLVNQQRAGYGLGAVTLNNQLNQAAQDFCCEMVEGDFFPADHINPLTGEGPADRVLAAGYDYRSLGENLARGHTSPQEVVTAWMNSPGHQAVILGADHTEIGVGICQGSSHGPHWVLDMASPLWP